MKKLLFVLAFVFTCMAPAAYAQADNSLVKFMYGHRDDFTNDKVLTYSDQGIRKVIWENYSVSGGEVGIRILCNGCTILVFTVEKLPGARYLILGHNINTSAQLEAVLKQVGDVLTNNYPYDASFMQGPYPLNRCCQ